MENRKLENSPQPMEEQPLVERLTESSVKKRINWWMISTIILSVLLAGTVSAYFLNVMNVKTQRITECPTSSSILVSPTPSPPVQKELDIISPSPAINETVNWSTYSNSQWGISFRYRGGGTIIEGDINNPNNPNPAVVRYGSIINQYGSPGFTDIEIYWSVWENNENLSLLDFYDKYLYQEYRFTRQGSESKLDRHYKIGNIIAIREDNDERPQGVSDTSIYIKSSSNRIYRIKLLHYLESSKMEVAEKTIKTIKVD